jgi:hypothetical protein
VDFGGFGQGKNKAKTNPIQTQFETTELRRQEADGRWTIEDGRQKKQNPER